jgi:hypothetical protein
MAITPNFSSSQLVGQPTIARLTDTSTGSDAAISQRRVYFVQADGTYLTSSGNTNDYETWAFTALTDAKSFDLLQVDSAINVTVQWLNSSNVVLYSKTILCGYTLNNETFYYSLTQGQIMQGNPPILVQDTQYYANKGILRVEIDSGNQAISLGDDIVSAQDCYNRATYMVTNQSKFF